MRPKLLRLALMTGLLTGACAGEAGDTPGPSREQAEGGAMEPANERDASRLTGLAAELDGRYFMLVSAEGFEPVAGKEIHVAFQGDHIDANASCNALTGRYRLDGAQLVIDSWSTTDLGCFGALGVQDGWYHAFVTSQPELRLDGNELSLRNTEATLRYLDREVASPDRPLVDTEWTVISYTEIGGVSTGFGTPPIQKATLRLASDGSARVDTGCNQGQGRYQVDGDRIALTELTYTEEGCALPLLEDKVQAVLRDGELEFAIESQRLTLQRGSIGLLLDAP